MIRARESANINEDMMTGKIEILVSHLIILNKAKSPIFSINDEQHADEVTKLKYRYLDLRRPENNKKLILRSQITQSIRQTLTTKWLPRY